MKLKYIFVKKWLSLLDVIWQNIAFSQTMKSRKTCITFLKCKSSNSLKRKASAIYKQRRAETVIKHIVTASAYCQPRQRVRGEKVHYQLSTLLWLLFIYFDSEVTDEPCVGETWV